MHRISALWSYPIKALAGVQWDHCEADAVGLPYDREWMLVDKTGKFVSQRTVPKLALFKVEIQDSGLLVRHYKESILIPFEHQSNGTTNVSVWKSELEAEVLNPEIHEWFSDLSGEGLRLVHFGKNSKRTKSIEATDLSLKFPDGYPILVAFKESLDDLNRRLEQAVPMDRFRPNIVLDGGEAWREFDYKSLNIKDKNLLFVKPCERCTVTTVDQQTGMKTGKEPLRSLVQLHGAPARFGMNAYLSDTVELKIGDQLF